MGEEVIIYTKSGCPYCQQQLDDYRKKGISFKEVNTSQDRQALKMIKEVFKANKVPVTVKNGQLESIGYMGKG